MSRPEFSFNVLDFIGGTSSMNASEVGGYVLLLCYQWEKGSIPDNMKEISRITRIPCRYESNLDAIFKKFKLCDDGRYRNMRLEKERYRHAYNSVELQDPENLAQKLDDDEKKKRIFLKWKAVLLSDESFLQMIEHKFRLDQSEINLILDDFFKFKSESKEFLNISSEPELRKNIIFYIPKSEYVRTKNSVGSKQKTSSSTEKLRNW